MKRILLYWLAAAMIILFSGSLQAQNATITDDLNHEADNSAILDIKSTSKGLLIPRLTTEERIAIVEPAYGLMVFDNDENSFYFYNGTEWKDVSTNKDAWAQELETVFLRNNGASVGIGTETPNAYVHIKMSEKAQKDGSPAFLIEDAGGPVTSMSSDSTIIYLNDTATKASKHGSFTVTGRSTKGVSEYFKVTPNNAQFYFEPATLKGVKGGFAVGGLTGTKGSEDYLNVTADSTVIAFYDTIPGKGTAGAFKIYALSGAKMNKQELVAAISTKTGLSKFKEDPNIKNGFQVVGYSDSRSGDSTYFQVDEDTTYINNTLSVSGGLVLENVIAKNKIESPTFISEALGTNVLFDDTQKGVKGGFAVGGLSGTKAGNTYLSVEEDSTTIVFNDTVNKGVKGGFAVGGLSGTKGFSKYLDLDKYTTRISFAPPVPGVKGGFAVGGLSGTKGGEDYLSVDRDSTIIFFDDSEAKGVKGGFAVGGLSGTKIGGYYGRFYFFVDKYNARINLATPAPGVKGGFAVGGLSGTKGDTTYFEVTDDTTFVYNKLVINDDIVSSNLMSNDKIESPYFISENLGTSVLFDDTQKGVKGGFAVGGLSGTKGGDTYLSVDGDSTIIIFNDDIAKGVKGGFAVGGLSGTKGSNQYFELDRYSARISFDLPAAGVKGGFAVGGLSGTKGDIDYLTVEEDSTRIYFDDTGAKGVKGGFAVGGLSGTKAGNQYFELDRYNARISLDQPAMGVKGGFAVGGLSGTKGGEDYLTVEQDSTRIYFDDSGTKGVKGGFAVGGLSGTKGTTYFAVGKDSTIFNNVLKFNDKVVVGNGLYSSDGGIRTTYSGSTFSVEHESSGSYTNLFSVSPWGIEIDAAILSSELTVGGKIRANEISILGNAVTENLSVSNEAMFNSVNVSRKIDVDTLDVNTLGVAGNTLMLAPLTVWSNATISGNVTINGTTTAVDVTATNVNITDVMNLKPRTSFPTSPSNGDMCIITISPSEQHIYCYLAGSWKMLDN